MYSKFVLVVAYLAIIAIASSFSSPSSWFHHKHPTETNKSHHLTVGTRSSGDKLVLEQNIIESSSLMKVLTIEQSFNISTDQTITQLQALDQKTNGNGAKVSLLGGGPGSNNVTLQFKSKRNHGINFKVLIYAK